MNEWVFYLLIFTVLLFWVVTVRYREVEFAKERNEWISERKELLDRIQAPTFAEFTSKVIREKKAEQPKEEEETYEYIG